MCGTGERVAGRVQLHKKDGRPGAKTGGRPTWFVGSIVIARIMAATGGGDNVKIAVNAVCVLAGPPRVGRRVSMMVG